MRRFKFYAIGDGFDVNLYLSKHKIDYSCIWERDKYQCSGLVKYLGNEYMLNIYEQEQIAYKYMRMNKNALKAIVKWESVDLAILCLSSELQIDSNPIEIYFSFEPKTMALAGEIGLKLGFNIEASIAEDWYTPSAEEY